MRKIVLDEVLDLTGYEKARNEFRARAIAAKEVRRIGLGDLITVFFENRLTMHYQLQEMMRTERMVKDEQIREEMAVWNGLVPGTDELSMTLMIEQTDHSKVKETLHELSGLEGHVALRIGEREVRAAFEPGRSDENVVAAVQYLKFKLSPAEREALLRDDDVRVAIDHPRYRAETRLPRASLEALREDLKSE
jgi:hypothetical protein